MMTKRILIAALAAVLFAAAALTFTACGDDPADIGGPAIEGWSDSWGADEWGNGYVPPSSDPDDYNTIDWSKDYIDYTESISATRGGKFLPFYPGNGAHKYEAENAEITGGASASGNKVGYLDNSSVTYRITSEYACSALVVLSVGVTPDAPDGVRFGLQYTMYCNDDLVDTDDCWLQGTGDWGTFADNPVAAVELKKGENTITFFSGTSRSDMDGIKLVPTKEDAAKYPAEPDRYQAVFPVGKIEAEDTSFSGAQIEKNKDRSGGMSLGFISSSTVIEFIVKNDTASPVTKTLVMNGGAGPQNSNAKKDRMTLTVGGEAVELTGDLKLAGSGNWYEQFYDIEIAEVTFPANSRTSVRITLSDSVNVDYFDFVDATA